MEIVNTLDIDGTQWEITDSNARQDIAGLKAETEKNYTGSVLLTLKPGFTAVSANISYVQKIGKFVFGSFNILGLAGPGIGSNETVTFAELPFKPWHSVQIILLDQNSNYSFSGVIGANKNVSIVSTTRLVSGVNSLSGGVMFIEE